MVPGRATLGGLPTFQVTLTGPSYLRGGSKYGPGDARVIIEKKNAGVPTGSDIAWGQAGPPIPLAIGGGTATNQVFSGTVTLPGPLTAGLYRLVVEQYELYEQGPGKWSIAQYAERIVHQDIFPLSPSPAILG